MAMEANGRLERCNNRCLWPESKLPRRSILRFEGWQTAGLNAVITDGSGLSAWELPRQIAGEAAAKHWRLANSRLERLNNRWLWRQTAGLNALTTNTCGQRAWSKLPRSILGVWRLECLGAAGQSAWSAAAKHFRGLKAGKRQAWTP